MTTDDAGICGGNTYITCDLCGVCDADPSNDNSTCSGCTYKNACNYNPQAIIDDQSCEFTECEPPVFDECGVENGPGPVYACGCEPMPEGACDCDGNSLDECGVCGGEGIPEGQCDCAGNVLDCKGVCGGAAELQCGACLNPEEELVEICNDGIDNDCNPDTFCYSVVQQESWTEIIPLEGNLSVDYRGDRSGQWKQRCKEQSHYQYCGGQTSHNLDIQNPDGGALHLYQDTSNDELSMVFILGGKESNRSGHYTGQISAPASLEVKVSDDNYEIQAHDSNELSFDFTWSAKHSDGFAIDFPFGANNPGCIQINPECINSNDCKNIDDISILGATSTEASIEQPTQSFSLCAGE